MFDMLTYICESGETAKSNNKRRVNGIIQISSPVYEHKRALLVNRSSRSECLHKNNEISRGVVKASFGGSSIAQPHQCYLAPYIIVTCLPKPTA